jgi:hypothetical protein
MKAKPVFLYTLLFIFVIAIGIGGWYLERTVHYSWSYESKVQDTVKEMVKPECLKAP